VKKVDWRDQIDRKNIMKVGFACFNPLFNGIVLSRDRRRVDEVTNFGQ
jgi:hypothetical protein